MRGFLCVSIFAVLAPVVVAAQESSAATVEEIRDLILYARYDEAIAASHAMLARQDLAAAERNEVLEVLATAQIANDDQQADVVLDRLFSRDPGYRLADPEASPRVQGAFALARRRAPTPVSVVLEHDPPRIEQRESPRIDVRIVEGRDAIQELRLVHRQSGETAYHHVVMTVQEEIATAHVPLVGDGAASETIEYYVIALAPSQTPLGGLGSAGTPIELVVPAVGASQNSDPEPRDTARPRRWWIWTLVSLAIAGGAVGGYFLARPDEPSGTLGSITLQQTDGSPAW